MQIRLLLPILLIAGCMQKPAETDSEKQGKASQLTVKLHSEEGTLSVYRVGEDTELLTQNAKPDFRPYLHPIMTPDGKGMLTEYSPGHHKHQTGLYWGFTRVNGRDYFHHPGDGYWERVAIQIQDSAGEDVSWSTVYHLMDEAGEPILEETQSWTVVEKDNKLLLDLDWEGKALKDITIGEYDYGGLFLRMPWREGIEGNVLNAARQQNDQAEGKRAMWVDVGMEIEGLTEQGHIAIFDHPDNEGFPQPWRVDGQLGIGPVRARMGDWQIPQGQTARIKHQLVAYAGDMTDLEITDLWEAYADEQHMYSTASLWGIAQKEAMESEFLSPEAAVDIMTLPDEFDVNVWASEPMITQPMAFCWDDRGRLWVAENRDYESRGDGFSNSGDSRILILEDTDGDGQADSRKVFWEGMAFPSALAVGFDGVYVGAPPHLLFVPDKDQNDKADVADIEILLTGWGIRDRHETINSFHWGPDGWLYGLEGFATPSRIRKPEAGEKLYGHNDPFPTDIFEKEGVDINGGVWRYHPTKDRFEVVAHGFSNPWGIDYDAKGQLFITACVIPHAFHVIPGGIYHRQGGQHFNPYVYSDIQTIVDHGHRSAHGGARVYLSDAFPKEQYGRLFMANIHEHAVLSDILEPKGSGFVAHHGEDFLYANNGQWIGFSMELGPGGNLYVLDWHDADICGKDVYQKETGRIYQISPKKSLAENWEGRYDDLTQKSSVELAQLQTSPSSWHARRARVILQHRAQDKSLEADAAEVLRGILEGNANPDHRLRAVWALHVSQAINEGELVELLDDSNTHIRAWAVQLLGEDFDVSKQVVAKFTKMTKDPSPVVRMYLASVLQRLDLSDRWELAKGLVRHKEDIEDHNIPLMLWFGIEPLVPSDPERALELAKASEIPLISQYIARRMVDADEVKLLVDQVGKRSLQQGDLLLGLSQGLEGRTDLKAPDNWSAVYNKLKRNRQLADLALSVSQDFGSLEASQAYMAKLQDTGLGKEDRIVALNALAAQNWEELPAVLPSLMEEPNLRLSAIQAVASYDSDSLGHLLLENYEQFSPLEKERALQSMASRSSYGWMLTKAMKEGAIPKRDLPAYLARQMRRVVGNGFVEFWGPIDEMTGDKEQAYKKYEALLTPKALANANLEKGHKLFLQSCGACHQLFGEGGKLGPDITGSNRMQLDYLLENILDPNAVIQDDYKLVVLTTRDGRTYSGNIASENERQLSLKVVGQEDVVLNLSDIQSRQTMEVSLMPEGLLATLSDQEVVDLVGYLQLPGSLASQ